MYLVASILCLVLGTAFGADIMEGSYNVNSMCTTVKTGTRLASLGSCDFYYECTNTGPVKTPCPRDRSYDLKTQTCRPSSEVKCRIGQVEPCEQSIGNNWVAVEGTCNQWIYCEGNKEIGRGFCKIHESFDPAIQRCIFQECSTQLGPNLVSKCQVVPPNMYFGGLDECKTWQHCSSEGKLSVGKCDKGVFYVEYGSCGDADDKVCDRFGKQTESTCDSAEEGKKIADPDVCGDYYLCKGEEYIPKSCSKGFYFDTTEEECVARQLAKRNDNCNRCEDAPASFVNAVDSTYCNKYYYCEDGKRGPDTDCVDGHFFDEDQQGCAPYDLLEEYVKGNGACAEAVAPDS